MSLFFLGTDDLSIVGRSPILYIDSIKTIVLGDLHLGQHEAILRSQSGYKSRNIREIVKQLTDIGKALDIRRVILNGDIKHNTTRLSIQERSELEELLSLDLFQVCEVVLIVGNHDPFLKMGVYDLLQTHWRVSRSIKLAGYLFIHGDIYVDIPEDVHTLILSHEHPSINLKDGVGHSLRAKAFIELDLVIGRRKVKGVIIPAAGVYTVGVKFPINKKDKFLSPILKKYAQIDTQVVYPFTEISGPYRVT